jgi:hypothetical protein
MMKWDSAYILSRRPDLIVINRGYYAAGNPLGDRAQHDPGLLFVAPMDRDLFEHLRGAGGYVPRAIEFSDGSRFFVLERSELSEPRR